MEKKPSSRRDYKVLSIVIAIFVAVVAAFVLLSLDGWPLNYPNWCCVG